MNNGLNSSAMHIQDIFARQRPTFSFEFFPPKSSTAANALYNTINDLAAYDPAFVSVTYGAGGSTRDLTHDLVLKIKETTNIPPIPHLTCVSQSEQDITRILERYAEAGISNILALRGDPPTNITGYDHSADSFQHAIDLVRHIKSFNESKKHPDPRGFGIGVAGFPEGHPDTPNRLLEMDYLKEKVDAGADYICTQLFFDNHDFLDFRDRCHLDGLNIPIIAGIMPITSIKGLRRMAELAGGAHFPASLLKALEQAGDDKDTVEQVGIRYAINQCVELLENDVDGVHLYTINQSKATREVCSALGLTRTSL